MKTAKVMYVAAFFAIAAVFALFEYGVIPQALIPDTPSNRYAIDMTCVLTGFGGFIFLLSLLRFPFVRRELEQADAQEAERRRAWWMQMRIVLWGALMLVNVVLYYEAPMTQNPTYCVLVLFIAGVCCWPVQQRKNLTR
ncbi:MAG: hypothetical protein ACI382_02590 [Alloprevotella sp.]